MLQLALFLLPTAAFADPFETTTPEDLDWGTEIEVPSEIVNGSEEKKWPQTVSLGAATFSACSGSLIAPRVVLTAGHCGADFPVELLVQFGDAAFGPDRNSPDQVIGFADFQVHPDYRPLNGTDTGAFDIALLELTEDAPVDPIWINTNKLKDRNVGEEVLSVGFGITSAAGAGGGTKRSATLVVDAIDDMFVLSNVSTNPDEANICSGDSGGPQYHYDEATDTWEQWAVHSWGDVNCVYNSGSTRTDVAKEFILDFVEGVHGTSDFCALTGKYDDGVCDESCDQYDPDCLPMPSIGGSIAANGESRGGCSTAGPAPWTAWVLLLPLLGWRRD